MSALARRGIWLKRISFILGGADEISDQMDFSPQNLDFLENDASDRPKPKNRNVRVGTAQKMAKTDFFYFRTYGRKTRKIDFLDICASDRPNFCGISNPGPPPTSPSKDSLLFPVDREIEPLRPKSRKRPPLPGSPGSRPPRFPPFF